MHKRISETNRKTKRLDTRVQKRGKKRRKIEGGEPIGLAHWSKFLWLVSADEAAKRFFLYSFSVATFLLSGHT